MKTKHRQRTKRIKRKEHIKTHKMNLFLNILNYATHLVDLGRRQEREAIEPVVNKKKSIATETELQVLAREFGELKAGKTITVELQKILTILPRARRKADAYKGLRGELKQQGVELIITSSRSHKKYKYNE